MNNYTDTLRVTFYDANGEWLDADEDFTDLDVATEHAKAKVVEGGYAIIHSIIPEVRVSWQRKFAVKEL